jgi:hypothetical protein
MRTLTELRGDLEAKRPLWTNQVLQMVTMYSKLKSRYAKELSELVTLIENDRPTSIIKAKARMVKDTIHQLQQAENTPPQKWLETQ